MAIVDVDAAHAERAIIDELRRRYELAGYRFTAPPDSKLLPAFLDGYVPDAVAERPGEHVAIELKDRTGADQLTISALQPLFESHPDWRLRVIVLPQLSERSPPVLAASPEAILDRVGDVRNLMRTGDAPAAFVMGWALLEAAFRSRVSNPQAQPVGAATAVQALAMAGAISPETEERLRNLIPVRNRIVHGDISLVPAAEEVDAVIDAVGQALRADPF